MYWVGPVLARCTNMGTAGGLWLLETQDSLVQHPVEEMLVLNTYCMSLREHNSRQLLSVYSCLILVLTSLLICLICLLYRGFSLV